MGGFISNENVFKVCDQPHPQLVKQAIRSCVSADFPGASGIVEQLWHDGYSGLDVIGTIFRIAKVDDMDEALKLEFMKEIGNVHVRILDGVDSLLQLTGLMGKLCLKAKATQANKASTR